MLGYLLIGVFLIIVIVWLYKYLISGRSSIAGTIGRIVVATGMFFLTLLTIINLATPKGLPGTLVVTLIYVILGVIIQYMFGLGLAMLCVQKIKGRNFFRMVFFIPMMITLSLIHI